MKLKKVLVIRFSAYGDILMCLPALASLRRICPDTEIHFLAVTKYTDVLADLRGRLFDRLIAYKRTSGPTGIAEALSLGARLRGERYDAIFDWQANPRSRILSALIGARKRFSFNRRMRLHQLDKCYLTVRELGVSPPKQPQPLKFARAEEDAWAQALLSKLPEDAVPITLGIGGLWATKLWAVERFNRLMEHILREVQARFFLVGDERDRERAARLASDFPDRVTNLTGSTTILQAAALVSRSALTVSNDTSTMHLAWVQGVPTIGIFGATDPLRTGPMGLGSHIFSGLHLPCHPCFEGRCIFGEPRCLEKTEPMEVASKALEILHANKLEGRD